MGGNGFEPDDTRFCKAGALYQLNSPRNLSRLFTLAKMPLGLAAIVADEICG